MAGDAEKTSIDALGDVLDEIVLGDEISPEEVIGSDVAADNESDVEEGIASGEVENKRQHQRFRVSLKVYIRLSNGDIAHAQAIDLSMGGIYIEYGASADKNKEFEMAFDLPFTSDFQRVFVKAKVVRSIVIGNRNMFGLAFIFSEFAKDTDKILDKYLEMRSRQV